MEKKKKKNKNKGNEKLLSLLYSFNIYNKKYETSIAKIENL